MYKLMKKNPENREDVITMTSGLNIVVNLLIAAVKVLIGFLASSIAIVSEGVNNATDALSSVLTLVGTKLAGKHPDEKHPFGYGRIEYVTSLVISTLILVTGVEVLISSIKLIIEPAEMEVSILSLIIVAVTALIKLFMGIYTIKMGKKAGSSSLEAVGVDCRNDSVISVITIASAIIFLVFHLNLDAYVGIITAIIIIKAGLELLKETLDEIIGRPGEHELAQEIYKEIRQTEGIELAVDMMLHNYGPDAWSGSVNVEMDHKLTVGQIYQILHKLQLHIMHEHHVTMVFGIYAVDNDNPESKALRHTIADFVRTKEHVKSYHAVYKEPGTDKIYCDFIVDYKLRDWDALRAEFKDYMAEKYPGRSIELVIETEFV